jgi:hypothetical protein
MAQIEKQDKLNVRKETHDQIKFLAQKSGQSMTQLVADVFNALFTVGCTYSALNLSYEYVISESKVTIQAEGRNNLEVSEKKHPNAKKESRFSPILVENKPKEEGESKNGKL